MLITDVNRIWQPFTPASLNTGLQHSEEELVCIQSYPVIRIWMQYDILLMFQGQDIMG